MFWILLVGLLSTLVWADAPVHSKETGIDSSLHLSCRNGTLSIVVELLKDSLLESTGISGHTPLLAAVAAGHLPVVELLLKHGANVAAVDRLGYSAIHIAAYHGRHKLIRPLYKAGLNASEIHFDGYAPIHRASWGTETRHYETMLVLLKLSRGLDALLRTIDGRTAADTASTKTGRKLLAQGAKKASPSKGFDLKYLVMLVPLAAMAFSWFMSSRLKAKTRASAPSSRAKKSQ